MMNSQMTQANDVSTAFQLNPDSLVEEESSVNASDDVYNHGKWSDDEHQLFIDFILQNGNYWEKMSRIITSRSIKQIRSHAIKYANQLNRKYSDWKGKDVQLLKSKEEIERLSIEEIELIILKHLSEDLNSIINDSSTGSNEIKKKKRIKYFEIKKVTNKNQIDFNNQELKANMNMNKSQLQNKKSVKKGCLKKIKDKGINGLFYNNTASMIKDNNSKRGNECYPLIYNNNYSFNQMVNNYDSLSYRFQQQQQQHKQNEEFNFASCLNQFPLWDNSQGSPHILFPLMNTMNHHQSSLYIKLNQLNALIIFFQTIMTSPIPPITELMHINDLNDLINDTNAKSNSLCNTKRETCFTNNAIFNGNENRDTNHQHQHQHQHQQQNQHIFNEDLVKSDNKLISNEEALNVFNPITNTNILRTPELNDVNLNINMNLEVKSRNDTNAFDIDQMILKTYPNSIQLPANNNV